MFQAFPTITVDSSTAVTELCFLGQITGADKSPYNTVRHRHPYTAPYTMLLSPYKHRPVRFAEIGVAGGASALMWDMYFRHPEAAITMLDRDENFLATAKKLVGPRPTFALIDVTSEESLNKFFTGKTFDVIIDDSTHDIADQIRIATATLPALAPGGLLIIEDVFRSTPTEDYATALSPVLSQCSAAYFVQCDHKDRWSPGWDNDRLLVLVKA